MYVREAAGVADFLVGAVVLGAVSGGVLMRFRQPPETATTAEWIRLRSGPTGALQVMPECADARAAMARGSPWSSTPPTLAIDRHADDWYSSFDDNGRRMRWDNARRALWTNKTPHQMTVHLQWT